ncbi:MAG TPA: OmpA family protein [Steroidobacter sp.]
MVHIIRSARTLAFFFVVGAMLAPCATQAQGFLDRLKRRVEDGVERTIENRVERKATEVTDEAMDSADCAATGDNCRGASGQSGSQAASSTSTAKPGQGAWKNYDFVPGDRVIFAEDFSQDNVGDFPRRLTFQRGNLEVVDWQGTRYLSTNEFDSRFYITLPETLPERFTLEFDYSAYGGNSMWIYFVDPKAGQGKTYVDMGTWSGGLNGGGIQAIGKPAGDEFKYKDVVFPVRIMADGRHVKVYMGDTRVANVPNADLGRSRNIYFALPGSANRAAMIGNLRIAAGGKKLYDSLAEKGRVATHGVLFDTGSDRIRPESTPTLAEIGTMLKEHPDLRLAIEGHTDNVGQDAANQVLSEKRAQAVRQYLITEFGIAGDRLEAKGYGASKPVSSNDTPEGRQQNRRVELVKLDS